jgi:lantibiotic transport system permease protein
MLTALSVELLKLNRSLAALLAVAAPGLIALFLFFNLLRVDQAQDWFMVMMQAAAIWAYFMLPMSVTALTALVAQMEHGPRSWEHLFALPVRRWRLLAAKAGAVCLVVAAMEAAVLVLAAGAGALAGLIKPGIAPTGAIDWSAMIWLHARIFAAAALLTAIQLWAALRFRSFVPGLVLGIGGTFFAVVATSAKNGVFMPWQMPVNVLATDPARADLALMLGLGGGILVLGLMLAHLSRREVV